MESEDRSAPDSRAVPPPSGGAANPGLPAPLLYGGRALAAIVLGREGSARIHFDAALAAGASPAALVETARMAHLFGGFPRAISGLRALADALAAAGIAPPRDPEPPPRSRAEDLARGEELFRRIYAGGSDEVLAQLDAVASGYSRWVLEDAYGRVLSRPVVPACERELLAVAALAALRCIPQLRSHARGALRLGATRDQVRAMIDALEPELEAALFAAARDALPRER